MFTLRLFGSHFFFSFVFDRLLRNLLRYLITFRLFVFHSFFGFYCLCGCSFRFCWTFIRRFCFTTESLCCAFFLFFLRLVVFVFLLLHYFLDITTNFNRMNIFKLKPLQLLLIELVFLGIFLRVGLRNLVFATSAIKCCGADRVFELQHGEEDLVEGWGAKHVRDVDTVGGLPNTMSTVFRLKHQCWSPVHFSEYYIARSCKCQSETCRGNWKQGHLTILIFLEFGDVLMPDITIGLPVNPDEIVTLWLLVGLQVSVKWIHDYLVVSKKQKLFFIFEQSVDVVFDSLYFRFAAEFVCLGQLLVFWVAEYFTICTFLNVCQ